jgi:hypothetical protein
MSNDALFVGCCANHVPRAREGAFMTDLEGFGVNTG